VRLREATSKFTQHVALGVLDPARLGRGDDARSTPALKPGTYRAVDYRDNDGIDIDAHQIEAAATIMTAPSIFDPTGRASREGPINRVPPEAPPPPASPCAPSPTRPSQQRRLLLAR
jgi:hypothetical protein